LGRGERDLTVNQKIKKAQKVAEQCDCSRLGDRTNSNASVRIKNQTGAPKRKEIRLALRVKRTFFVRMEGPTV